jgi:nicotinate-nucleotide adenylyltransferase
MTTRILDAGWEIAGESGPPPGIAPGSIGIFGGTFDPIHYGHLALAEEAREALGLERVLFVPASIPPHKADRTITSVEDRVRMIELAIGENPAFEISRVELDRPGLSYTVDTLAALRDLMEERFARPLPEPTLILSAESFSGLRTWHRPERILELCRIAVAPRPGHAMPPRPAFLADFPGSSPRIIALHGLSYGHSSSDVRARVAAGRTIRYQVPPAVAAYIGDHHLYEDPARRSPAS